MRSLVEASRLRLAAQGAAIALISAGIAGCSADVARFQNGPPFASRGGAPNEVTGTVRPTQGAPTRAVESQPLPGAYQSSALPPPPPPRQAASPPPPPPVQQAAAPARTAGVHTVGPHETLITIAKKYRKTPAEIARANGLSRDSRVRLGQRLTIPGVPQSQIHTAAAQPAPAKPAPTTAAQATKPAAPQKTPAAQAKAPAPQQQPQKVAGVQLGAPPAPLRAPVEKANMATATHAPDVEKSDPVTTGGATSFRWPVRGRVITGFGPKANGQQNDGINLAVPEGTSVKAAEDGVVAYAGNELKGYGNLVLVRHSNGFVTAYAHARELKVKRGESVKRGQIIALAGQTGNVSSPQLHFEIRKGSTPVDPMPHLSGN
ncbi:MAG: M23 family metallopeptidase [Variibacter sp.]|nr:M23 family metallopeptidase [Variibacter sp.]